MFSKGEPGLEGVDVLMMLSVWCVVPDRGAPMMVGTAKTAAKRTVAFIVCVWLVSCNLQS